MRLAVNVVVRRTFLVVVLLGVAAGLYLLSRQNYLLFHSLAELGAVVVGILLFTVAARMYRSAGDSMLMLLGIGFFWASIIDLVHMLAYKGMGVFPDQGADLPTQLWVFARYLQAVVVLAALLGGRRRLRSWWPSFIATGVVAAAGLIVIFAGVFPTAYQEGSGLTGFKVISEYVVSALWVSSLAILVLRRGSVDTWTFWWLALAMVFTTLSELAFTFYVSVFGLSNAMGHMFKMAAYLAVYLVIQRVMFTQPMKVMRRFTPICAGCKAVRCEDGTWVTLEEYIDGEMSSSATHGICPSCIERLYPDLPEVSRRGG